MDFTFELRAPRRSERGILLLGVLLFAFTILALAGSVLVSSVAASNERRYLVAVQRAQDAAESGVHHVVATLNSDRALSLVADGGLDAIVQGEVGSVGAVRYVTAIAPAGADGADNDLDGKVDEADESDMYEVTSTGHADRVRRTVRATILARYPDPGVFSAAYLENPLADLSLNGNSFLISGRDISLQSVATGKLVAGLGVAGDPTLVRNQLAKQQLDNVVGLGGNPSVHQVPPLDLRELIDAGARAADVRLAGNVRAGSATDWGTITAPKILYGTGEVHLSGNGRGAGALIVEGDLTISGDFKWWGLVVVRGTVTFSGGGTGKTIVGGVVVQNDISGTGSDSLLGVNGNVEILYSEEAIAAVMRVFKTFVILNWREGPNPSEVAHP